MKSLRTMAACHHPVVLRHPRPLPLEDMTSYELVLSLEEKGWQWRRSSKGLQPYCLGGPLVWATAGCSAKSACAEYYLLALLSLDEIQQQHPQISEVPHGFPRLVYVGSLAGKPAPERIPIPMAQPQDQLVDDVAGQGEVVLNDEACWFWDVLMKIVFLIGCLLSGL